MPALLCAAALFTLLLSCSDPGQGLFIPGSGRIYIKTMGGDSFDDVRAVAETGDGGLFFAGRTESRDAGGAWLIMVNRQGRIEWQKVIVGGSGMQADKVLAAAGGGFFLAGTAYSPEGEWDTMIASVTAAGDVDWIRRLEIPGYDQAITAARMLDGSYVVGSVLIPESGPANRVILMRLDSGGAMLWQKAPATEEPQTWVDASPLSSGGIVATINLDGLESLIFKMDASGNVTWAAGTDGSLTRIIESRDGGLLATGSNLVMKLDAHGNVQWQKTWAWGIASVLQAQSGDFILVGNMPDTEFFEIRLTSLSQEGNPVWQRVLRTGISDWVSQAALLSNGDIALAGHSGALYLGIFHDALLARLTPTGEAGIFCDIVASSDMAIQDASSRIWDAEIAFEDVNTSLVSMPLEVRETAASVHVYCPK